MNYQIKTKNEIKTLVDDFYLDDVEIEYKTFTVKASELNLVNRLDVFFKLNAIDSFDNDKDDLSCELYKEHIKAMTNGSLKEKGNKNKNTLSDFIIEFKEIIRSIKDSGFDQERSLIPVNEDMEPLNGAHRIACALFFDEEVTCVVCKGFNVNYNFDFFKALSFDDYYLYALIQLMQTYQKDIITSVIWPSVDIKPTDVFDNVIVSQSLNLNFVGMKNFVLNTYLGEPWVGKPENNFLGSIGKSEPCSGEGVLQVVVFKFNRDVNLISFKDEIRKKYNLGKHSIHICDDNIESAELTKFALNPNIENILNNISNYKYSKYISSLMNIATETKTNDIILSGSSLLGLLGLREPNDIDYLYNMDLKIDFIDYHGESNGSKTYNEILKNPYYNFIYFGVIFYSPSIFVDFKRNRAEAKDIQDIKLIQDYTSDMLSFKHKAMMMIKMRISILKVRVKERIKSILRKVGIFEVAKKIIVRH